MKIAILACALAVATPAHAQSSDSVAAAEQLFAQARTEMDAGNYAAACPLFEASRKLDPQRGTLLNLAACYEKAGLIASAWGRFKELEVLAGKANDEARAQIARERVAALEPRLPKLAIHAPRAVAGLAVTRDNVPIDVAMYGTHIYVDPGEHVIAASAPGYKPHSTKLTLREAEMKEVRLPELEKLPDDPALGPRTVVLRDDTKPRRIVGLVLVGAGVAALATGVGFGISARQTYQSAFDDGLCFEDTNLCHGAGQERTDRARERATIATVLSGVGAGLAVGGAVLYLLSPRVGDVGVAPNGSGGATVTLGGRW